MRGAPAALACLIATALIAPGALALEDNAHARIHAPTRRHAELANDRKAEASGDNSYGDERWHAYVPELSSRRGSSGKSLAEELVEARERARQAGESAEAVEKTAHAVLSQASDQSQIDGQLRTSKAKQSSLPAPASSARDQKAAGVARRSGRVVRRAARSARRRVDEYMHPEHDDDDDDDDDDEDDDVDDDDSDDDGDDDARGSYPARRRSTQRVRRTRRRQPARVSRTRALLASLWQYTALCFWFAIAATRWTGRSVLWTPTTYFAAAVQWSAHTSWHTTRWTGQHALVGPARTVSAPLVYLVDGLLFIFVWLPANAIRFVVHELYPVYVFLGAGLAVGTALGIGAALILFISSYVFGDTSQAEANLAQRGAEIPREVRRSLRKAQHQAPETRSGRRSSDSYAADTLRRKGINVLDHAIDESLQREDQARRFSGSQRAYMPESERYPEESDGDDPADEGGDYFFGKAGKPTNSRKSKSKSKSRTKGKGKADQFSFSEKSGGGHMGSFGSASASNAPGLSPFGHPLPPGVTAQGGWNSRGDGASTSPATSPQYLRGASMGSMGGASLGTPGAHPYPSPGAEQGRAGSLRQRRSVAV